MEENLLKRFQWAGKLKSNKEGQVLVDTFLCGVGWYKLIYDMLVEIEQLYRSKNRSVDMYIWYVKEKYGVMETNVIKAIPDVYEITLKYEALSEKVCEKCGDEGRMREDEKNSWLKVRCDKCYEEEENVKKSFKKYKTDIE
jgi:hypothetical protein